jgi:hypothetical protein
VRPQNDRKAMMAWNRRDSASLLLKAILFAGVAITATAQHFFHLNPPPSSGLPDALVVSSPLFVTSPLAVRLTAPVMNTGGNLVTVDAPNSIVTAAVAINASGDIVGRFVDTRPHGFVRTNNGLWTAIDLSNSDWYATVVAGINDARDTTGSFATCDAISCNIHGFVRDQHGKTSTFDPPGAVETFAIGINNQGTVAGYYNPNPQFTASHGFVRDKKGDITVFDAPGAGALGTYPTCINSSGEIAGIFWDALLMTHGFIRDSSGNVIVFDPPNSTGTGVWAVNDGGEIAGSFGSPDQPFGRGFVRHQNGSFTVFDAPNAVETGVVGINNSSEVTGYFWESINGTPRGFFRDQNGRSTVFDAPSGYTVVTGINNRGDVLGQFLDASDHLNTFIRIEN